MAHTIARTLDRVRTLFHPRGKHRVKAALPPRPDRWRWATEGIEPATPLSDHSQAKIAPTVRLWYTPIDGASTPLVRPYLTAHEREEKVRLQRLRRDTLWCATYGVDLDTRDIHACLGAAS